MLKRQRSKNMLKRPIPKTVNTVAVSFYVYIQNDGYGSVSARFFSDKKMAEQVAEADDERFDGDIQCHVLVVDLDNGRIISGVENFEKKESL